MGAIPTLITNNPKDLREPAPLTQRILEQARGGQPASRSGN